ncbi:MAG: hypothetical protein NTW52_10905 [Planctomycetota bacterium]|nr:hypothetical protein [Planctomycetota bacterium]
MTLEEIAIKVIEATEMAGMSYMTVGAIAAGTHGIPRSTSDVDLLIDIKSGKGINTIVQNLEPYVRFSPQVVFDTFTWGRRHIGKSKFEPPYGVELFETFDDPFVHSEFSRRYHQFVPLLGRKTWLPTAEDVIVQKLRWGRSKDLDDARDVLAVQGPETLDMVYINHWCTEHGTIGRLQAALDSIPPL